MLAAWFGLLVLPVLPIAAGLLTGDTPPGGFPSWSLPFLDARSAAADEEQGPPRLSRRYRRVARLRVPVQEISGWTPLPVAEGSGTRRFLACSDEGLYHADGRRVEGALFEIEFRVADVTGDAGDDAAGDAHTGDGDTGNADTGGADTGNADTGGADTGGASDGDQSDGTCVSLVKARPISIHLGDLIPRLDPAWARGGSIFDLEACVPLPGTTDLYLLAGERNPEDVTDGGANRLYVIRYPAPASPASTHATDSDSDSDSDADAGSGSGAPLEADGDSDSDAGERPDSASDSGAPSRVDTDSASEGRIAQLVAYLRLPDLADDQINDRFEAVVAVTGPRPDTWLLFAFKERTEAAGRPPVYLPLRMRRTVTEEDSGSGPAGKEHFEVGSPHFRSYPLDLPALIDDRDRLGAQADAGLGPNGLVWVLDRWRRELHVAEIAPPPALELRYGESFDVHDLIGDVPGEQSPSEPAAPGGRHAGYGRHEAMCFDAHDWIWLAADLGGGRPSIVTVLAPRTGLDGARGSRDGESGGAPGR